jgi:putative glutamine amidotransferase
MSIRIAIPEPASPQYTEDALAYNARSLPQYLHALHSAGATPILIPLHETPQRVAKVLSTVHGILLPGSGADIEPQKYARERMPQSAPADAARESVDELLLQDAFNLHKPILGICYGAQALNVWCGGSLVQDIPALLGDSVHRIDRIDRIDHEPGRTVDEAHGLEITPQTRLSAFVPTREVAHIDHKLDRSPAWAGNGGSAHAAGVMAVNSSHHQAIQTPGDNLRVTARTADGVIEAVELDSPSHFVVGVQWHPERTYDVSPFSRAIFAAFVQAAAVWTPRAIEESVLQS